MHKKLMVSLFLFVLFLILSICVALFFYNSKCKSFSANKLTDLLQDNPQEIFLSTGIGSKLYLKDRTYIKVSFNQFYSNDGYMIKLDKNKHLIVKDLCLTKDIVSTNIKPHKILLYKMKFWRNSIYSNMLKNRLDKSMRNGYFFVKGNHLIYRTKEIVLCSELIELDNFVDIEVNDRVSLNLKNFYKTTEFEKVYTFIQKMTNEKINTLYPPNSTEYYFLKTICNNKYDFKNNSEDANDTLRIMIAIIQDQLPTPKVFVHKPYINNPIDENLIQIAFTEKTDDGINYYDKNGKFQARTKEDRAILRIKGCYEIVNFYQKNKNTDKWELVIQKQPNNNIILVKNPDKTYIKREGSKLSSVKIYFHREDSPFVHTIVKNRRILFEENISPSIKTELEEINKNPDKKAIELAIKNNTDLGKAIKASTTLDRPFVISFGVNNEKLFIGTNSFNEEERNEAIFTNNYSRHCAEQRLLQNLRKNNATLENKTINTYKIKETLNKNGEIDYEVKPINPCAYCVTTFWLEKWKLIPQNN